MAGNNLAFLGKALGGALFALVIAWAQPAMAQGTFRSGSSLRHSAAAAACRDTGWFTKPWRICCQARFTL